jgi:hypothetical protein
MTQQTARVCLIDVAVSFSINVQKRQTKDVTILQAL